MVAIFWREGINFFCIFQVLLYRGITEIINNIWGGQATRSGPLGLDWPKSEVEDDGELILRWDWQYEEEIYSRWKWQVIWTNIEDLWLPNLKIRGETHILWISTMYSHSSHIHIQCMSTLDKAWALSTCTWFSCSYVNLPENYN